LLIAMTLATAAGCGSTKKTQGQTTTPKGKILTRQQVVDFVDEAIRYAKANGREKAVAEFNNPKGKFVRGELYIYAYDWSGVALANGGNPALAGQNLINMTDPNGVKVIQALIKVARSGGGWVNYTWPYPKTKTNEPKLGYANRVDDAWWLGSGMYEKTP
jgi:signal transduction histidine kinase